MPATQTVVVHDGLEISATPVHDPDPVYFTDEAPEFDIHILNNDSKYNFSAESKIKWTIETNPMQVIHQGYAEFGPLDNGDSTTVRVGGEVLSYEGHGVLGVSIRGASGEDENGRRKLTTGHADSANPIYSFSVWDSSDYEAEIKQPKKLQKWLLWTSILLILFAGVQILLAILSYVGP